MDFAVINYNQIKKDENLQKIIAANDAYYGKPEKWELKTTMPKLVDITNIDAMSFCQKSNKVDFDINQVNYDRLFEVCNKNDLRGMSGDNQPVTKKLYDVKNSKPEEKMLFINAIESDPGLVHDEYIYRNLFAKVKQGVEILNQVFHFAKIILATRETPKYNDDLIKEVKVPNYYPIGYEKYGIKYAMGVDIIGERHPSQYGILSLNIQTVYKIACLFTQDNNDYRWITVANMMTGKAFAVKVPYETPVRKLIENVLGVTDYKKYIGMGAMAVTEALTVDKVSQMTNFLCYGSNPDYAHEKKCNRCGKCTKACPKNLKVAHIVKKSEKSTYANLRELRVDECINCGLCSFVCKREKNVAGLMDFLKKAAV